MQLIAFNTTKCWDRSKTDRPEGKKSHNSFKAGPTNGNNTYGELQELAARQCFSGNIFVMVTFQDIVFSWIMISIKF